MRKFKKIVLMGLFIICLCGCWDKRELEDNTFVILLGVDKADEDSILVTAAFPLTQTEESSSGEGGAYSVMSVRANFVAQGLNLFGTKLSGPVALYPVKTVVISQELAQSGKLRDVFSSWSSEEINHTTNVLISECTAAEFIQARIKQPLIEPLKQEDLLLEQSNNSAYFKPVWLLDLIAGIESGKTDSVAMYGTATEIDDKKEIQEPLRDGYLPAEIPITADNKTQLSGFAVFRGADMVGVLNSSEAQIYSLITQSKVKQIFEIPNPIDPNKSIAVTVKPAGGNKTRCSLIDGNAVFDLEINLKCSLEQNQSMTDSSRNHDYIIEYVKQTCLENMQSFIEKIQKVYNADILKLGDKLAYKFTTINQLEDFSWREKYREAEINLIVNVNIERTGMS